VAAFAYAVPHVLAYLMKKETFALVAEEAAGPELWTGWLALAIFLLLAVTSNNASIRWLGRSWRGLHRWIHVAALLTFAHWVLSAFDSFTACLQLAVLAALEALRIWKGSAA
jgi:methionine sulfoxide reductase heme-binding subunit